MITQIESLRGITPIAEDQKAANTQIISPDGSMFGQIFQTAIQSVRDTDAEKVEAQYLLSTGQLDNPSTVMIAASKNELAVNMLVQLRNKALEAYSELTRMSV